MDYQISIFGLGYVGTVLLGCLAGEGNKVIGVDVDKSKLDLLKSGISPILEDGIQSLIGRAMNSHQVELTDDPNYAIQSSDVSFICVGTPSLPNGSQDLSAIERVTEQYGKVLKKVSHFHVFIIRSTVGPGTVEKKLIPLIEKESGKKLGEHFGICFMPEFLREGSSIKDYYNPPFTIAGGDSPKSVQIVENIFKNVKGDFIKTKIQTAEMVKYCCNIFHALKITFANEIGRICQKLGIDSKEVMELVCRDTLLNISPAYLKPGFSFGGSCLPKDLRGLTYTAKMHDVSVPMISNILPSNQMHVDHATDMVLSTGLRSIGMVGLSFKGGTDDLRESPFVIMAERFIGKGLSLKIYDPYVSLSKLIGANRRYIENTIPHIAKLMCTKPEELIKNCQAFIIGQNDNNFIDMLYNLNNRDIFVLDMLGTVKQEKIKGRYKGVCW